MAIEIVIAGIIVIIAVYMLYKSIKKKSTGDCGCGQCNSKLRKIK